MLQRGKTVGSAVFAYKLKDINCERLRRVAAGSSAQISPGFGARNLSFGWNGRQRSLLSRNPHCGHGLMPFGHCQRYTRSGPLSLEQRALLAEQRRDILVAEARLHQAAVVD